jgi:hypothetical protein
MHAAPLPMPRNDDEVQKLRERIRELEEKNEELKTKLDRARGVPAEVLVAQMTGGERTEYKDRYDVRTQNGNRIEVKLSKVHTYRTTKTKRWTWDSLLGSKEYDFLVLAGEKDSRCSQLYPPKLVYLFFLIPQSAVSEINSRGDCVSLTTDFSAIRAGNVKARILIERYLVRSEEEFKKL